MSSYQGTITPGFQNSGNAENKFENDPININQVIHPINYKDDDSNNENENLITNDTTFFTEGILEENSNEVSQNEKDESNSMDDFCDKNEEVYIENDTQLMIKPSVYFNLNKLDKDCSSFRPIKSVPNRHKPYSSLNRLSSETSEKGIVYPFFGDSVQFLPSIQSDKDKFPNRKNLAHRRVFLRYVTNKIEKETEFVSMIRSNTMPIVQSSSKSPTLKPKHIDKNYSSKDSESNYYDTRAIFAAPPPPPPSAKFRNMKKQLANSVKRSKSQLAPSVSKKTIPEVEDEKYALKPLNFNFNKGLVQSNVNSINNIVDINVISNSSKLSGHYLYDGKQRLADLNLNEVWPTSSMYRVTIKENPWVSSFKAKSQANEINSNFRDTFDSNLTFSRLNSNSPMKKTFPNNFFPNIKNML